MKGLGYAQPSRPKRGVTPAKAGMTPFVEYLRN
jgi:hypothetical protein